MTDNQSNNQPQVEKQPLSVTRSLSRMAIGGIMLGLEVITGNQKVEEEPVDAIQVIEPEEDQVYYDILPDSSDVGLKSRPVPRRRSDQSMPYIMTGVLLDTSRRVGQIFRTFDIVTGRVGRTVEPIISPLVNNPIVKPFKNRFDRLVRRGEGQINQWEQLGMKEDTQGRELIESITFTTVDTSVDYIVHKPEVKDLAKTKTKSLASTIIEYLRSYFVSSDILLLGIFSEVLNKPSLIKQAKPPVEIMEGATWRIIQTNEALDMTVEPHLDETHIGYFTGFINRITALIIDLFVVGVSLTVALWFINTSSVLLGISISDIKLFNIEISKIETASIIGVLIFTFYNTLMWTLFGNTIGQIIMGIRVLTKKGDLPSIIRSFLRATIGISLSLGLFIITFIVMIFDRRHRGLHDMIFGTVVVYTWDAHPSARFLNKLVDKYQAGEDESDSKLD